MSKQNCITNQNQKCNNFTSNNRKFEAKAISLALIKNKTDGFEALLSDHKVDETLGKVKTSLCFELNEPNNLVLQKAVPLATPIKKSNSKLRLGLKSSKLSLYRRSIFDISTRNPPDSHYNQSGTEDESVKNDDEISQLIELKKINKRKSKQQSYHHRYHSRKVVINVGGQRFETYRTTLKLIGESRLANITPTNSDYDPIKDEYFFDRDPDSFQAILNYFRTGRLHAPNSVCGNLFYDELNFWGIGEHSIQPCCWTTYSTKRDCDEILKRVMEKFDEHDRNYYFLLF
jgi:hypothetical protein